jgi:hypothetical protein
LCFSLQGSKRTSSSTVGNPSKKPKKDTVILLDEDDQVYSNALTLRLSFMIGV